MVGTLRVERRTILKNNVFRIGDQGEEPRDYFKASEEVLQYMKKSSFIISSVRPELSPGTTCHGFNRWAGHPGACR
jgi:hypothetical protein